MLRFGGAEATAVRGDIPLRTGPLTTAPRHLYLISNVSSASARTNPRESSCGPAVTEPSRLVGRCGETSPVLEINRFLGGTRTTDGGEQK